MRRGTPSPSDLTGMEAALRLARAASVREEVPVGAVVVAEGDLLGEAHNETIQRRDPTAHAELLALQRALQKVGEDRLLMATMYVTLEPCAQCAGAIVLTRLAGWSSEHTMRAAAWRARSTTYSETPGSTIGPR